MYICRLKPDHHTCCSCIDAQLDAGKKKDCEHCPDYCWVKLLKLGSTIFGRDYAYVSGPSTDWRIRKVDIKRIGPCYYTKSEDGDSNLIWLDNRNKEKAKESK